MVKIITFIQSKIKNAQLTNTLMRKFLSISSISFLLIGFLFQSCTKTDDTKPAQQTVTVGALLLLQATGLHLVLPQRPLLK